MPRTEPTAARERDAFEALYYAFRQPMFRAARRILGSDALAEDAVQDAFLKLSGLLAHMADMPPDKARAFVLVVTENKARDILRKYRREFTDTDLCAVAPGGGWDDTLGVAAVRAAVDRLPTLYRDVLALRVYLGKTDGEIADALGLRPPAVRKRMQRARDMLAALLEREDAP